MSTFAERLQLSRKRKVLSQGELARLAKVAPESISRFEAGERMPRHPTARRLAEALEDDAAWLMYGEELAGPEGEEAA
jgi:transcriptional regulator with XRE-family HTH domain